MSTKTRKNRDKSQRKWFYEKNPKFMAESNDFGPFPTLHNNEKSINKQKLLSAETPNHHEAFTENSHKKWFHEKKSKFKIFMAEKATILALFHGRHSGILWGRLSPVLLSGPGLGRALLHHRQLQLMGLVQPGVECWGLLSKCCYKK